MKKISIFLSVIFIGLIKSQTISDYKYIMIPSEITDFKGNRSFGLGNILGNAMKGKKYIILSETKTDWPAGALTNPCQVLNADIQDDKSMFRNKVILEFKDCNSKVIFTEKGNSAIKEFEAGYKEALKQTLVKIPASNPSSKIENTAQNKPQETVQTPAQTLEQPKVREVSSSSAAQKYTKGNVSFQKIQIADDQFILVDGNSSVPFATFKSTAKKDVYRVKLASGESTLGYYENGNIIIEIPKSNGEYSNEVFTAN